MFRLPTYTVTVWYRDLPETIGYRELLIKATETFPSAESEHDGMHNMYWGTEGEDEAMAILEKLKPFVSDCNVVVIRLSSPREDFESVIYKDHRSFLIGLFEVFP